jgi:hypothetical protein
MLFAMIAYLHRSNVFTPSPAADANINLHMDNPELRQHQLLAGFPKFFVVVHDPRVELKSEPRTGSPTVRTIANVSLEVFC